MVPSPSPSEPAPPTAVPIIVRRDAQSEPMPCEVVRFPDMPMTPAMEYTCLGVAFALQVLLESFSEPGHIPEVFDERLYPLCGPNAPLGMISFVWSEPHPSLGIPHYCAAFDFVRLVVSRLKMTLKELVLAYAMVEQLIYNQPPAVQTHSVRPIFLIASVVATKVTNDFTTSITRCFRRVRDVFTTTSVPLLVVMERQLLICLHFHVPTGPIHEKCAPPPRTPISHTSQAHPIPPERRTQTPRPSTKRRTTSRDTRASRHGHPRCSAAISSTRRSCCSTGRRRHGCPPRHPRVRPAASPDRRCVAQRPTDVRVLGPRVTELLYTSTSLVSPLTLPSSPDLLSPPLLHFPPRSPHPLQPPQRL